MNSQGNDDLSQCECVPMLDKHCCILVHKGWTYGYATGNSILSAYHSHGSTGCYFKKQSVPRWEELV